MSPRTLVLKSPCYTHIIAPEFMASVCDSCLASPNIFDHIPPVTLYRCSKCKLSYYCNVSCQKNAWKSHVQECKYLKKIHPKVPPAIVRFIIRTCFKNQKEPQLCEELPNGTIRSFKDLEMHKEEISISKEKKEAFSSFLQVIKACLGDLFSAENLFETYCKILINCTEITDCMGSSVGTGLYLGLSAVDHSCKPNVNVVFNNTDVELTALDTIEILEFENARVSYHNTVLPIRLRQARLLQDYFFQCSCDLCNDKEMDRLCASSFLCQSCKGPVKEGQKSCPDCGKINNSAHIIINKMETFLSTDLASDVLRDYDLLKSKFHIYDFRMVELSEKAMAVCLTEQQFEKFFQIGEHLMPALKLYFHPNSISFGLHLAKLAKAAIYLNKSEEAMLYLKQCFDIFKMSHGEDSSIYKYLIALRDTI